VPPQPLVHLFWGKGFVLRLFRSVIRVLLPFDEPLDGFLAGVPTIDVDGFQFDAFVTVINVIPQCSQGDSDTAKILGGFCDRDEGFPE